MFKHLIKLVYFITPISFNFHACATQTNDVEKDIEKYAAEQGIHDPEQIELLKTQALSIIATNNKFAYKRLKVPCSSDLEKLCQKSSDLNENLECLKSNRSSVSTACQSALRNEFGSEPFKQKRIYNGVTLPEGSTFFYDPKGNILGAMASDSFEYNGITFRKGQVRFHSIGVSVAQLTHDQVIDGVKYSSEGIGPFFDDSGNVLNATLAEDTTIDGVDYKGGTQIEYYSPGKLKIGTVTSKTIMGDKIANPGETIYIDYRGNVEIFSH